MRRPPPQLRKQSRRGNPGRGTLCRGTARAGLTLAELSVSLAIIATLMVAIGSVMVLTGRAVGMTATQAFEAKTDDLLTQIASELRMALTVPVRTETTITFTVADRDGDLKPEKIQYEWGGKGTSLTRRVNDGPAVTLAPNVEQFRVGYILKTQAAAAPVEQVESPTTLLFAHTTGATSNHTMSLNAAVAQSINLGKADATSWSIDEVQFMAMRVSGSTTGKSWQVSICNDEGGKPAILSLLEPAQTIQMANVPSTAGWISVKFTNAVNLDPAKQYWFVVRQTVLTSTGSVVYDPASSNGGTDANGNLAQTALASIWTAQPARDMRIQVYGKYKHPAP